MIQSAHSSNSGSLCRSSRHSEVCLLEGPTPLRWFLGETNFSLSLFKTILLYPAYDAFLCLVFISCWLFLLPCWIPSGDFKTSSWEVTLLWELLLKIFNGYPFLNTYYRQGAVLSTLHASFHLILTNLQSKYYFVILNSQMKKYKQREVKWYV